jgi:hypothetical protein
VKRRLLIQVTGGAVVAAVMLGAIMLPTAGGGPDFDFLRGQRPLQFKEKDLRAVRANGQETRMYTFKANSETLTRRARAELIERGFQDVTEHAYVPDSASVYVKGDVKGYISASKTNKQFRGDCETVTIVRGMRYIPYPLKMDYDGGWVTVYVASRAGPSIFERFKAWIGL